MKRCGVCILLLLCLGSVVHAQLIGIKIAGDTCNTQTINLQVVGTSSSPYFFWHFGDPNSGTNDSITITGLSPSPFPTHTFSSPGVYTVCVSFQEPGMPIDTICRTIAIGLCCNGAIIASDSCLEQAIPFVFSSAASISSINWNFDDPGSGINNLSNNINPTHLFTSVGAYWVRVSGTASCGIFSDSLLVSIVQCSPPLPCTGLIVASDSCVNTATNFSISSTQSINAISWQFGDPLSGINNTSTSLSPVHTFSNIGVYSVQAIVSFDCGTDTLSKQLSVFSCDTVNANACKLWVPNAFSPNADQRNDFFGALSPTNCPLTNYILQIYNRWGELVFNSNSIDITWDGFYRGQACPVGPYFYIIQYQVANNEKQLIKGDVMLVK